MQNEIEPIIDSFWKQVDQLFGFYLDTERGYQRRVEDTKASIDDDTYGIKVAPENMFESFPRLVRKGEEEKVRHLHEAPMLEIIERNSNGGLNHILLGQLTIVYIYQIWEDHYRGELAKELGKDKNEIKVPLFNDLRHLRRSIIHRMGFGVSELRTCEVLKWFQPDEQIVIDKNKIEELVDLILHFKNNFIADNKT